MKTSFIISILTGVIGLAFPINCLAAGYTVEAAGRIVTQGVALPFTLQVYKSNQGRIFVNIGGRENFGFVFRRDGTKTRLVEFTPSHVMTRGKAEEIRRKCKASSNYHPAPGVPDYSKMFGDVCDDMFKNNMKEFVRPKKVWERVSVTLNTAGRLDNVTYRDSNLTVKWAVETQKRRCVLRDFRAWGKNGAANSAAIGCHYYPYNRMK